MQSHSLSRDQIVLENGDLSALVSVEAVLIGQGEAGVSTSAEGQRQRIILLQRLINFALLHVCDRGVLRRQP